MDDSLFLSSTIKLAQYYQSLGLKTMEQLDEDSMHWEPAVDANSIGIIVKHVVENIHSRFTNFLTEDGEKPWRNRDNEFIDDYKSKEESMRYWIEGWSLFIKLLNELDQTDLETIVYIRNEGHTALEAIQRQITHYAYHTGQIVFLGKLIKGEHWHSLSIPKNQSASFNKEKFDQKKEVRHFTDNS